MAFWLALALVLAVLPQLSLAKCDGVPILEPIGNMPDCIPIGDFLGTRLAYFEPASKWLYNVAVGIAVLWTLIGGIQVMTSGDDQGKRSEGFDKMKYSIGGLAMLVFAGVILRSLNGIFFTT